MSSTKNKRNTPKGFARTPTNLNSTVGGPGLARASTSRNLPSARASIARNLGNCTLAKVWQLSSEHPVPRTLARGVDPELECDLVFNEYLIALMKKELVQSETGKYKQEMQDQLAAEQDNLYESQTKLEEKSRKINSAKKLRQTEKLLGDLEKNVDKCVELMTEKSLQDALEALCSKFEKACNKVVLKNFQPITNQESFDQLVQIVEESGATMARMGSPQPMELFEKLGNLIRKYEEFKKKSEEKQTSVSSLQKRETFKLLKKLSDMYAQRGKYGSACSMGEMKGATSMDMEGATAIGLSMEEPTYIVSGSSD